jgi:hypothetical protein
LLSNRCRAATTRPSTPRLVTSSGGCSLASTMANLLEASTSAHYARGTSVPPTSTSSWTMPKPLAPPALMWEQLWSCIHSWLTTRPLGFTCSSSRRRRGPLNSLYAIVASVRSLNPEECSMYVLVVVSSVWEVYVCVGCKCSTIGSIGNLSMLWWLL